MSLTDTALMALEYAQEITGAPATDEHTQNIAFMLTCAAMARDAADRGLTVADLRAGAKL